MNASVREQVLRDAYGAAARGDAARIAAIVPERFEFRTIPNALVEPVMRGPAGIARFLALQSEAFADFSYEIEEVAEHSDRVLAVLRVSVTGRSSGAGVETRVAHVWAFEQDTPVRLDAFLDPRQAMALLGPRQNDAATGPAAPPRLVDVLQRGRARVIAAWDLGGAIVDPGPESRMETLLAGLSGEPRALLLTHIHLDHAGAAGALVERFPDLEVWVHERGAPHLADPTRLLRSAGMIYGDEMEPLWGRVVPVPERNLRVLSGGEAVEAAGRRLDVAHTPGHASHHVTYFDRSDGTAYVGDVAGVRIMPGEFIRPPTPPPDIDVAMWQRSIDMVAERRPARLALTHFGMVDNPQPHLARMKERLDEQAGLARRLLEAHGNTERARDEFVAAIERRTRESAGPDDAEIYEAGAPGEQLWLGLVRYWSKQPDGAAAQA